MTSTTAGRVLEKDKDKDKVEKRRALGRGLESLLPGPRVVAGTAVTPPAGSGAAVKQQVPHAVRNDNAGGVPIEGTIQAVVDDTVYGSEPAAIAPATDFADDGTRAGEAAPREPITISAQAESRVPGNIVVQLAISDIDKNPFQTRYVHHDDALAELTESIKANGVLQPIVVRPAAEDGRYILVLGERRLHASKLAGRETIPAIVRRVSEQQAAEMTIIENLQRQDLSPLEQAEAFRVLSEEFKLTQAQIGERVGLSRVSVANYMRLLRLPREVMQLLAEKKLNFAEAKELLRLEDNDQIAKAALFAVKKGMNIEQIERLVMRMEGLLDPIPGMPGTEPKKGGARWVDPNVRSAQVELERLLGVRVKIRDRKGKGKIVIEYSTVDDYERVVGMLRGK